MGHFERLTQAPPVDPGELRTSVQAYVAGLRDASGTTEFIDLELATALEAASLALLDRFDQLTTQQTTLAQAAIQYFVLQDDAENDLSVIGLDDDAAVFNAVVRHLGFSDLVVELP